MLEAIITGNIYIDILEHLAFPQLEEDEATIFQQDGALPSDRSINHYAFCDKFPGNWIGKRESFGP